MNKPTPINVPILGQPQKLGVAKVGASIAGIPIVLDESGLLDADLMRGPDGQPAASLRRESFMDATQLLEAIRAIVREELDHLGDGNYRASADDAATAILEKLNYEVKDTITYQWDGISVSKGTNG